MSLRTLLIGLVLLWIAFAVLGAVFHVLKFLIYVAIVLTVGALIVAAIARRSLRR